MVNFSFSIKEYRSSINESTQSETDFEMNMVQISRVRVQEEHAKKRTRCDGKIVGIVAPACFSTKDKAR